MKVKKPSLVSEGPIMDTIFQIFLRNSEIIIDTPISQIQLTLSFSL